MMSHLFATPAIAWLKDRQRKQAHKSTSTASRFSQSQMTQMNSNDPNKAMKTIQQHFRGFGSSLSWALPWAQMGITRQVYRQSECKQDLI